MMSVILVTFFIASRGCSAQYTVQRCTVLWPGPSCVLVSAPVSQHLSLSLSLSLSSYHQPAHSRLSGDTQTSLQLPDDSSLTGDEDLISQIFGQMKSVNLHLDTIVKHISENMDGYIDITTFKVGIIFKFVADANPSSQAGSCQ